MSIASLAFAPLIDDTQSESSGSTVLPWSIKALSRLDQVRQVTRIVSALGKFLPETTRAGRVLAHADDVVFAMTVAVEQAVAVETSSWHGSDSSFILTTVKRFGTLVIRSGSEKYREQCDYWVLGPHIVRYKASQFGPGTLETSTPIRELLVACVVALTQELGTKRLYLGPDGLRADDVFGECVTPTVAEVIEDIRAELATGERCRTVLLYGPPGSGKSSAARQIARAFGETTLTIDAAKLDLGSPMRNSSATTEQQLTTIAVSCGAEAIVFDDYDRRGNEGQSLALISDLRRHARVVIFTANNADVFSGAEARPQRFDKIVQIAGLDYETAHRIAPDLPASIADEAWTKLLASYLRELAVLCRAGRVDPRDALEALLQRQAQAETGECA